ncbi:elongator complex associated protein Kti2 [Saitoella complicata NRRL Y-17804]|uniref:Chromatin associated protein KTI12 n=1 Tax=Saitoella complicata (strain BCRC 22490 / CBS 7301 / JCM 7358 / NBRC 10748 / NRRL Y-17804) TaxID=698492 RepID=A0A0E9NA95_SAICN|nr:elongator complex associated protein Kti2 [Saitoella complicata NRRL Y-17804]ODQ53200.1 elongator complex associated protein Kti2 [Saitoella complicata NRRL Y-17804]GAO46325.1 hypothetical protein G7K_0557-t1 [Saitoella complicata NRRL Y-17804]
MPLIIISGFPSSGKTTRANEIKAALLSKIESTCSSLKVHHISDDTLHIPREIYRDTKKEKSARGTLLSAAERVLSPNDIVILDSMNYIKGFRYQLYCKAKEFSTPHCVVHVGVPIDISREWNKARGAEGYPEDVLEALLMRYEEPNAMTRWDSPLFTIPAHTDEKAPVDDIWDALHNKAIKPNSATVLKPALAMDYLTTLDRHTQEITKFILDAQTTHSAGLLPIPDCTIEFEMPVEGVSMPKMQRLRRQFVGLNRMHAMETGRIRELFVEFLNGQLSEADE